MPQIVRTGAAVIAVVLGMTIPLTGWLDQDTARAVSFACFIAAGLLAIYVVARSQRMRRVLPMRRRKRVVVLRALGVERWERSAIWQAEGRPDLSNLSRHRIEDDIWTQLMDDIWFAWIEVANASTRTYSDVAAHVEIWDEARRTLIHTFTARWRTGTGTGLSANGMPRRMDLIAKRIEAPEAWLVESGSRDDFMASAPDVPLAEGTYSVRVNFRSDDLDEDMWFRLHHRGRGHNLEFEPQSTNAAISSQVQT